MRRLDWHQQGLPRHQAHSFTLGQEAVVPLQIAVSAAMEAFALVRGDQRFLAGRKDSHRLFAFDLGQDVMLRVHVERRDATGRGQKDRSEEHTSELQSLMRISYAVFCLKKKTQNKTQHRHTSN